MSSIRTNYEKWYEGDEYYWGTEPARFCDELIMLCPPSKDKKVLDIGCGEGKDAVYMAQKGYAVTSFDLTGNGIKKTLRLAAEKGVEINAYVDDIILSRRMSNSTSYILREPFSIFSKRTRGSGKNRESSNQNNKFL